MTTIVRWREYVATQELVMAICRTIWLPQQFIQVIIHAPQTSLP